MSIFATKPKLPATKAEWAGLLRSNATKFSRSYRELRGEIDAEGAHIPGILRDDITTRLNLAEENFYDAALPGAYLTEVDFTGANFNGADLRRADLSRAKLGGAILNNAELGGSNLTEATLLKAELANARLERTQLDKANFKLAMMNGASLKGADLGDANYKGRNHAGANFTGAMMQLADLRGVRNIEHAVFSDSKHRANLRGATFSSEQDAETARKKGAVVDAKPRILPLNATLRGEALPESLAPAADGPGIAAAESATPVSSPAAGAATSSESTGISPTPMHQVTVHSATLGNPFPRSGNFASSAPLDDEHYERGDEKEPATLDEARARDKAAQQQHRGRSPIDYAFDVTYRSDPSGNDPFLRSRREKFLDQIRREEAGRAKSGPGNGQNTNWAGKGPSSFGGGGFGGGFNKF